ncbi:ABC transporter substrate-binding protein [Corynebacterium choanae]|uniref:Iron-enterobactin transporter periplasmic binding protein n=1 Tax=Corynebacterium choanae TaxID=1862358 RepID=A0A3G6J8F9_9CORY|nr:ABC transporter substrate-binding protein [Corynebacterium choanae]AZA14381.1 iron-enterobactin transporter periplasmic binding protein [Corynebacterium choanae]
MAHSKPKGWLRAAGLVIRLLSAAVIVCLIFWIGLSVAGKFFTVGISEEDLLANHPAAVMIHDPSNSAWPMTVATVHGDVVVHERPGKAVALTTDAADNLVALELTPSGIPDLSAHTATGAAITPWLSEGLSIQKPELLELEGDTLPYDQIASLDPGAIFATGSNLREDQFRTLSRIAPTIDVPVGNKQPAWEQSVQVVGTVMGAPKQVARKLDETEHLLANVRDEETSFRGTTTVIVDISHQNSLMLRYGSSPTAQLLEAFGFTVVGAPTDDQEGFFTNTRPTTWEEITMLNPDLVVVFYESDSQRAETESNPIYATIPAVHGGHVVGLQNADMIMALRHPTVLSIPWTVNTVVPLLRAGVVGRDAPAPEGPRPDLVPRL